MSDRILDHIIDSNYLELSTYSLVEGDVRLVKDLMSGANRGERGEKKWAAARGPLPCCWCLGGAAWRGAASDAADWVALVQPLPG
jgi:hypothetical protein